jgi:acetylornithine deacetylase
VTPAEILRTLVAIPTPSAITNLPLIGWVQEFVQARGWRTVIHPYTDESGVAKANLIARPARANDGDAIGLAFVCHTDTVPYAASWSTALELRDVEGNLHGCGACDVKGALACFLAALHAAADAVDAGTALILTADEEVGCKGMERLLADGIPRIGAAIVSEPTSLRLGVAGKGYGLARVSVEGVEAHSAFPAEGESAIRIAVRMVERIYGLDIFPGCAVDKLFDPVCTTLNVGVIDGGTAKNIIAGRCTFLVEWRPIPEDPSERVLHGIERLAVEMRTIYPRALITIEPMRTEAGLKPAEGGRLRGRLAGLSGKGETGLSFGSEASRIARIADEVIVMGPGDMHTAHSEREFVPVRELGEWTEVLGKLIRRD